MTRALASLPVINTQEFAQKGEEIYGKMKDKLEKKYYGKFVAIEIGSGKYFIGDEQTDAIKKAKDKFPKSVFYIARPGFKGAIKISSYQPPFMYGSIL